MAASTNLVDRVEIGNDIKANLWTLVLQLCEEQWQQMFDGTAHTQHHTSLSHC